MRKLERIVDTIINTQDPETVLVTGGDTDILNYLTDKVDTVTTTFKHTDSFDLIVVSGPDVDTDIIHVFGNTTTVVIEETEGGKLKHRNTGLIHTRSFGDFVYLTDDGPHVILYSRDPYVVRDVGNYTPTTPSPTTPSPTTIPPTTTTDTPEEDFESGIDESPDVPSYYWKPSRGGTK